MKLNFNFNLLDLDGKELSDANAGKIIATTLVQSSEGDALKFWEWALKLNKGEVLELDTSDTTTLEAFVNSCQTLPILTKAQILLVFKK